MSRLTFCAFLFVLPVVAQEQGKSKEAPKAGGVREISKTLRVDLDKKQVLLDSYVVLREGPLELFLCMKRTKEHEAVLAADVEAKAFHAALLLIGAVPGKPSWYDEAASQTQPPTGQKLKITVEYKENGKTITLPANDWIKQTRDGKPMQSEFLFAGSQFVQPEGFDKPIWLGDEGDLICVANFSGAIIDVARVSSKDNSDLLFETFTEHIPPLATPVLVRIEPIPEPKASP